MVNPWRSLRGLPRPLYTLAATMLLNRMGAMVIVMLALYLTRGLQLSAEFAGLVVTLYGATGLCISPVVGRLCDRYGAKPIAVAALALSGCMMLLFPLVQSPAGVVVAAIVLASFTEGFRPANMTLVGKVAGPAHRKTAFALQRLAANLGMSIGPAVGGLLATLWFPAIFIVDGITSLAAAALLAIAVPAAPPPAARPGEASADGAAFTSEPSQPRRAYTDPAMLLFLAALFGTTLAFFQFVAALPLYMVRELHLSESAFGLVFTVNTVLILAIEVPLTAATTKWSPRLSLVVGSLLVAIGFGATGLASGFYGVMLTVVIWTFGEMIMFPSATAYVADLAPPERTGEYMGLYNMLFGLCFAIAPIAGVTLLERHGGHVLWGAVFACGLASAILSLWVRRPPAAETPAAPTAADDDLPPPSSRPLTV